MVLQHELELLICVVFLELLRWAFS